MKYFVSTYLEPEVTEEDIIFKIPNNEDKNKAMW